MNQTIIYRIMICVIAGLGAGVSTGFAGLSAAVYISPMLVAFLDMPIYDAVGVSLASDVLASAVSAYTYGREGNIDLKRGKPLILTVWFFAIVGSVVAYIVSGDEQGTGNTVLSYWAIITSFALGIWFMIQGKKKEDRNKNRNPKGLALVIGCGIYIGMLCGFQGTGGGMMLLLVLTAVMCFEFKKAVGTSVFIMAFTALIGAVSHFIIGGLPDMLPLFVCVISTMLAARWAAYIANKSDPGRLKFITGVLLAISAVVTFAAKGLPTL